MKVFLPTNWNNECAVGAFLMDSFHYMKNGKKGRPEFFMPEVLDQIWMATGFCFIAVCCGGAKLVDCKGNTFSRLLDLCPAGLKVIVPVICGNDLFGHTFKEYDWQWEVAARKLMLDMRNKSESQFAVIGGSARLWKYDSYGDKQCLLYDANVERLSCFFQSFGVRNCTGVFELSGVSIADGVGHVDVVSKPQVVNAVFSWAQQALSKLLPRPRPPPPPPPGPPPPLVANASYVAVDAIGAGRASLLSCALLSEA